MRNVYQEGMNQVPSLVSRFKKLLTHKTRQSQPTANRKNNQKSQFLQTGKIIRHHSACAARKRLSVPLGLRKKKTENKTNIRNPRSFASTAPRGPILRLKIMLRSRLRKRFCEDVMTSKLQAFNTATTQLQHGHGSACAKT